MKIKSLNKLVLVVLIFSLLIGLNVFNSSKEEISQSNQIISLSPPNPESYDINDSIGDMSYVNKKEPVPEVFYSMQMVSQSEELIPEAGDIEKILIIPVQFTDVQFNQSNLDRFPGLTEELRVYYEKNSRYDPDNNIGISLDIDIAPVVTSDYTMAHYGEDRLNDEDKIIGIDNLNGSITELTREAVVKLLAQNDQEESPINFTDYDIDNDGVMDHIFIIHAGQGQEEKSSETDNIWSHYSTISGGELVYDSVNDEEDIIASNYIMFPENCQLGVVAHEFGHDLGLPDLYDVSNDSFSGYTKGLGRWAIMSAGSWNYVGDNEPGSSPSSLSPWSREYLGWVTPREVSADSLDITISNTEGFSEVLKVYPNGNTSSEEYYLVEYRRQLSSDIGLPGQGVLIWHIDTEQIDNYFEFNRVNDYKTRLGVELEQADGRYDIKKLNQPNYLGDETDPFGGSGQNKNFMAVPYGFNYSNVDSDVFSYVDILNINYSEDSASMDIYVSAKAPEEPTNLLEPINNVYEEITSFTWEIVPQVEEYVLTIMKPDMPDAIYSVKRDSEGVTVNETTLTYQLPLSNSPLIEGDDYTWKVTVKNTSDVIGIDSLHGAFTDKYVDEIGLSDYDIIFDPINDYYYISDKVNNFLYRVNRTTNENIRLKLSYKPMGMDIYSNTLYIALPSSDYDNARISDDQNGYLGLVNLNDFSLEEKPISGIDPYDVDVSDNGYIYISSGSGETKDIRSYLLSDLSLGSTYTGLADVVSLELIDNTKRLYLMYNVSLPYEINSLKIIEDGTFDSVNEPLVSEETIFSQLNIIDHINNKIFNSEGLTLTSHGESESDLIESSFNNDDFDSFDLLAIDYDVDTSENIYTLITNDKLMVVNEDLLSQLSINITNNFVDLHSVGDIITLVYEENGKVGMKTINQSLLVEEDEFSFSFDGGEVANRLIGGRTSMEYSIDGGGTYTALTLNNELLGDEVVALINETDDIIIRYKDRDNYDFINNKIIDVLKMDPPLVTLDDVNDDVGGIDDSMEFSIDDGGTWTGFDNNLPDLSGLVSLQVRTKASGVSSASDSVTLEFTAPVPTPAPTPAPVTVPAPAPAPAPVFIPIPIPVVEVVEPYVDGVNNLTTDALLDDIQSSTSEKVIVEVKEEDGKQQSSLEGTIFDELKKSDKPLVIDGKDVDLEIPPTSFDHINIGTDEKLKLNVEKLSDAQADKLVENPNDNESGLFRLGNKVFEFSAAIESEKSTKHIDTFDAQLTISIKLSYSDIRNIDKDKLGVYYYNEVSKEWEYISSYYNAATRELVFTTNHFSFYSIMEYNKTFDDIQNHWAKEYIEIMASRHITKGKSDSEFDPNANTTKAEFAALVVRARGFVSDGNVEIPFEDVQLNKWYYSEIQTAYESGLLADNVTFRPDQDITREEMMVIIVQALKVSGKYTPLTEDEVNEVLSAFKDADQVDDNHRESVALAVKNGIILGRTLTTLVPDATATRAETMVVVTRLLNQINGQ